MKVANRTAHPAAKNNWRIIPNIRYTALTLFISCLLFLIEFMLSQAQDVKLCVKTYCAAILRSKINNNSRKTYRGFAAYEARQGGVVGMIKRGFCLRLFAGRHLPLKRKGSKRFGLILCNLTHKANSQNTANTGLAHLKRCANKINASP